MEYKKYGDNYYIRLDKGDEIISSVLSICKKEGIDSATFYGIGGCSQAEIQTFIPEHGSFETETLSGMLELVSMTGNVALNENNELTHHTHAIFAYKSGNEHFTSGGHIKSVTVLYTAEIELRPVIGGRIHKRISERTTTVPEDWA